MEALVMFVRSLWYFETCMPIPTTNPSDIQSCLPNIDVSHYTYPIKKGSIVWFKWLFLLLC